MADEKKEKEKKKKKLSSAKKRDLQSEKRRLAHRSFRAGVLTAVRSFESAIAEKKESPLLQEKLSEIYSLLDKGVKKGVYPKERAARTKSRLSSRV